MSLHALSAEPAAAPRHQYQFDDHALAFNGWCEPCSDDGEPLYSLDAYGLFAAYDAAYSATAVALQASPVVLGTVTTPPSAPASAAPPAPAAPSSCVPLAPAAATPSPIVPMKEKKFSCTTPGCGKAFSRRDKLRSHEKRAHSVGAFPCMTCGAAFHLLANLKLHVHQAHSAVLNADGKTTSENVVKKKSGKASGHACRYCAAIFRHGSSLSRHISKNHRVNRDADRALELKDKNSKLLAKFNLLAKPDSNVSGDSTVLDNELEAGILEDGYEFQAMHLSPQPSKGECEFATQSPSESDYVGFDTFRGFDAVL